ncbi:MAG TPA: hypothetical protein VFN19_02470 [Candidatus Nanopelagicales bacterium]|jgi:hypothetical protein|nr:hypothetical protein [Candidatus Nanopelagicales bacterium]
MSRFPSRYRGVSVTEVDVPLELEPLRALLTSRQVYRRTEYMVVRNGAATALVAIRKSTSKPLFCDVDDIELLAGPDETVYLHRPEIDTAVPSQLVKAFPDAGGARCVVVEGKHGHVSFVLDPAPLRLHVLDVAPPWPAKLIDQVERVLDTAEYLPDLAVEGHVVELAGLLPDPPPENLLLQCRGGGMDVPGSIVDFLDEVPEVRDWVMLGCERSRQIHEHFYGDVPGHQFSQIDTCPRVRGRRVDVPEGEVLLTKCCLLEEHVETEGRMVVVPWGASFSHLREALGQVAQVAARAASGTDATTAAGSTEAGTA